MMALFSSGIAAKLDTTDATDTGMDGMDNGT